MKLSDFLSPSSKAKKNWTTFDNRRIPIKDLTHQHLSNIVWWHSIINAPCEVPKAELIRRFGEVLLLDYKPVTTFKQEIDFLFNKGYISSKTDSIITVKGKIIGKI